MRRLSDTGTSADSAPTGLDEAGRQAASDVAWAALTLLDCDVVEVYVLDELAGDYIPGAVAASGESPVPDRSIVAEDLTAVLSFSRVSIAVPGASALARAPSTGVDGPLASRFVRPTRRRPSTRKPISQRLPSSASPPLRSISRDA